MKLIAHRGWNAGAGENSLAAFEHASRDQGVVGVEFDVSRAARGPGLVVSHDAPSGEGEMSLDTALSFLARTDLELFLEVKEEGLAPAVIDMLVTHGAAERSVVFGFAAVARSFPWRNPRPVRLGLIVKYPWSLGRELRAHRPDMLLMGWDDRAWTRAAFLAWWSAFSLAGVRRRYGVPVVVGVVQRRADLDWLSGQDVHAAVVDMDRIEGTATPAA
jgi:hypothetical protein